MGVFLLVEDPAPNPGEHKVFWYAGFQTAATRFKESLVVEDMKNCYLI